MRDGVMRLQIAKIQNKQIKRWLSNVASEELIRNLNRTSETK
jgi:hypothetical protein